MTGFFFFVNVIISLYVIISWKRGWDEPQDLTRLVAINFYIALAALIYALIQAL